MEEELIRHDMLGCLYCPIGKDIIKQRYERLKEHYDWQPDYCCCEKIGEEHFWIGGLCEDASSLIEEKMVQYKPCRAGKAYRRFYRQLKNDHLFKIVTDRYKPHAGFVSWKFEGSTLYYSSEYIRFQKSSKKQRFLKKCSNHLIRRIDDIGNGNAYRKHYDYWNMMY